MLSAPEVKARRNASLKAMEESDFTYPYTEDVPHNDDLDGYYFVKEAMRGETKGWILIRKMVNVYKDDIARRIFTGHVASAGCGLFYIFGEMAYIECIIPPPANWLETDEWKKPKPPSKV